MKNLETENKGGDEELSELDLMNLTEWLIFKIKIIYGRPTFEGDTPEEASAIRLEWQDLVRAVGKKGVLAMVDYLLSGHQTVPSFPPAPVEFRKCYRTHVSSSLKTGGVENQSQQLTSEQRKIGVKRIKEILEDLQSGFIGGKNIVKNAGVA